LVSLSEIVQIPRLKQIKVCHAGGRQHPDSFSVRGRRKRLDSEVRRNDRIEPRLISSGSVSCLRCFTAAAKMAYKQAGVRCFYEEEPFP
jgi:hypothetical protein